MQNPRPSLKLSGAVYALPGTPAAARRKSDSILVFEKGQEHRL